MSSVFNRLLLIVVLLACVEREAKAYADPGSGALLWQLLVAGFFGAIFYLRRVVEWFRSKGQRNSGQ
jgi:hypothetical protein